MTFDIKPDSMKCTRCKRAGEGENWVVFLELCPVGTILSSSDGRKCDPIAIQYGYHQKCLPPNIYHKLAGSLPADHATPMVSLIKRQHIKGAAWNRLVSGAGRY